jgi:ribosomal protein L32
MVDEFVLAALLLGSLTGWLAVRKGESFLPWFLLGSLLTFIALPWVLLMKGDRGLSDARRMARHDLRKCPSCAELIRREARVCRFCGIARRKTGEVMDAVAGKPKAGSSERPGV